MAQQEIDDFLKKKKEWLFGFEIINALDGIANKEGLTQCLRKMRDSKTIEFIKIKREIPNFEEHFDKIMKKIGRNIKFKDLKNTNNIRHLFTRGACVYHYKK